MIPKYICPEPECVGQWFQNMLDKNLNMLGSDSKYAWQEPECVGQWFQICLTKTWMCWTVILKYAWQEPECVGQWFQICLSRTWIGGARWLSGRVSDSGARRRGSIPTAAVLCPWARHFTPRKYWLITQEAVAPSRHDWKIVDWDVKPQHKQKTKQTKEPEYVGQWFQIYLTRSWICWAVIPKYAWQEPEYVGQCFKMQYQI